MARLVSPCRECTEDGSSGDTIHHLLLYLKQQVECLLLIVNQVHGETFDCDTFAAIILEGGKCRHMQPSIALTWLCHLNNSQWVRLCPVREGREQVAHGLVVDLSIRHSHSHCEVWAQTNLLEDVADGPRNQPPQTVVVGVPYHRKCLASSCLSICHHSTAGE